MTREASQKAHKSHWRFATSLIKEHCSSSGCGLKHTRRTPPYTNKGWKTNSAKKTPEADTLLFISRNVKGTEVPPSQPVSYQVLKKLLKRSTTCLCNYHANKTWITEDTSQQTPALQKFVLHYFPYSFTRIPLPRKASEHRDSTHCAKPPRNALLAHLPFSTSG